MPSNDPQRIRKAPPAGSVLLLSDGKICKMVRGGREASPVTTFISQRDGPEREIPLADIAQVMWSPTV